MTFISTSPSIVDDQESTDHNEKKDDASTSFIAPDGPVSAGEENPITWDFHRLNDLIDRPYKYAAGPQPNSSSHPPVNIHSCRQGSMPSLISNVLNDSVYALGGGSPATKKRSSEVGMDNFEWIKPSATPAFASWASTSVTNPAPPNSSCGGSSPQSPRAVHNDLSRRSIDDNFRLVLKHVHDLSRKLEAHADFTEIGFQSVNTHIHELSHERNKADATAKKCREDISHSIKDLIDMVLEEQEHGIHRCEDESESRKVLDSISRRVTNLIDLVIEDLPNILEERGFHRQCAPSAGSGAPRQGSAASESSMRVLTENMRRRVDGRLSIGNSRISDLQYGRLIRSLQTVRRRRGGGRPRRRSPDRSSSTGGVERIRLRTESDSGGARGESQEHTGVADREDGV